MLSADERGVGAENKGWEGTSWAMKRSPTVIATFAKLNQSDKFYYIYIISYYS